MLCVSLQMDRPMAPAGSCIRAGQCDIGPLRHIEAPEFVFVSAKGLCVGPIAESAFNNEHAPLI